MSTMQICSRDNPFRPVDWRWQTVKYLQEHGLRLTKSYSDSWLAKARRFVDEQQRASDDLQQFEVAARYPAIYGAFRIYKTTTVKSAKYELEARLLASEPVPQIADKTGITEATVAAYAELFFDVAPKLKNPGYIAHVVLGPSAIKGISEREPDVIWKMFGYWCGPVVLDLLIYRFKQPCKAESPQAIAALMADDIREQLLLKTMIAVRSLNINWQTQTEVLNTYLRMLELERTAGGGDGGSESMKSGIQGLLESLPWTRDAALAAKQSLVEFHDNGVELRADELLLTAAGQRPQNLDAILASAVYPARSRQTTVSS